MERRRREGRKEKKGKAAVFLAACEVIQFQTELTKDGGETTVHPVTYRPQTKRPVTRTRKGVHEESGSSNSLYSETSTEDSRAVPGKKASPSLPRHASPLNFHLKAFFTEITQTNKAEN